MSSYEAQQETIAVDPVMQADSPTYQARLPKRGIRKSGPLPGSIKAVPQAPGVLAHRPADWMMNKRGELVPVVVTLRYEVGVGCVGKDGDPGLYFQEQRRNGFTIIRPDVLGPGTDLFRVYDTHRSVVETEDDGTVRTSNQCHETVLMIPLPPTDGQEHCGWAFDHQGWADLLGFFRTKQIIRSPRPEVVRRLLNEQTERLASLAKRAESAGDGEHRNRLQLKQDLARTSIANLERELAESMARYGEPAAVVQTRSAIRDLIAAADPTPVQPAPAGPPPIAPPEPKLGPKGRPGSRT